MPCGSRLRVCAFGQTSSTVSEAQAAWTISAHPATVREIRRSVADFAQRAGFHARTLDDIKTCVSEAVTNAIVHAYRGDRAPGTITVQATVEVHELQITVSDDGLGFRPRPDSPGIGLGLPTIATLTDTMAIEASAAGGTTISMGFTRRTGATKHSPVACSNA
jgi:serine/threonine-protein kinase RsbW/stage II sporulation protein AB (anti-sigma F factor)